MAFDYVGIDVRAKFGDSILNSCRIIRLWPTRPALRSFVQYLIAFCSQPETASDIIFSRFVGPIVPNKPVKFHIFKKFHTKQEAAFRQVCSNNCGLDLVGVVISGVDV